MVGENESRKVSLLLWWLREFTALLWNVESTLRRARSKSLSGIEISSNIKLNCFFHSHYRHCCGDSLQLYSGRQRANLPRKLSQVWFDIEQSTWNFKSTRRHGSQHCWCAADCFKIRISSLLWAKLIALNQGAEGISYPLHFSYIIAVVCSDTTSTKFESWVVYSLTLLVATPIAVLGIFQNGNEICVNWRLARTALFSALKIFVLFSPSPPKFLQFDPALVVNCPRRKSNKMSWNSSNLFTRTLVHSWAACCSCSFNIH